MRERSMRPRSGSKRRLVLQLIDHEMDVGWDVPPIAAIESGTKEFPQAMTLHLRVGAEVFGMHGKVAVAGPMLAEVGVPETGVAEAVRENDDRERGGSDRCIDACRNFSIAAGVEPI